jgi:hypothetical protein
MTSFHVCQDFTQNLKPLRYYWANQKQAQTKSLCVMLSTINAHVLVITGSRQLPTSIWIHVCVQATNKIPPNAIECLWILVEVYRNHNHVAGSDCIMLSGVKCCGSFNGGFALLCNNFADYVANRHAAISHTCGPKSKCIRCSASPRCILWKLLLLLLCTQMRRLQLTLHARAENLLLA